MAQLFTSRDSEVRHTTQLCLQAERVRHRVKFRPAVTVDKIRTQDTAHS